MGIPYPVSRISNALDPIDVVEGGGSRTGHGPRASAEGPKAVAS